MSDSGQYDLAVDLGTTLTTAAIARDGRVEPVALGHTTMAVPSVVVVQPDGAVLVGDQAVRLAASLPSRVARQFKRRLGDPAPLILGSTPFSAESLMAAVLSEVLRYVTAREGQPPRRVALTHPANYGPYKLASMGEIARLAGISADRLSLLPEPTAAAISYSTRHRLTPGEVLAVYDFGGGTFDVSVLRQSANGFTLLGQPDGIERFGGIDIDTALVSVIDERLGGGLGALDPASPSNLAALARLRDDCREAKESLSGVERTTITASIPGQPPTETTLTRADVAEIVRPRLAETTDALRRCVNSAGLTFDDVSRVLLVGGSSMLPGVAEAVQATTGRPIAVDAHPKLSVALGAAAWLAQSQPAAERDPAVVPAPGESPAAPGQAHSPGGPIAAEPAAPHMAPAAPSPLTPPARPSTTPGGPPSPAAAADAGARRARWIGLAAAAILLAGGGIFLATRGTDRTAAPSTTPPATSPATTPATPPATSPVTAPASTPPSTPPSTPVTSPPTTPETSPVTAPSTSPPAPVIPVQPLEKVAGVVILPTITGQMPDGAALAHDRVGAVALAGKPFHDTNAICPAALDPLSYAGFAPAGLIRSDDPSYHHVWAAPETTDKWALSSCTHDNVRLEFAQTEPSASALQFTSTPESTTTVQNPQIGSLRGGVLYTDCRTFADALSNCRARWQIDGFAVDLVEFGTVSTDQLAQWLDRALPAIIDGLNTVDLSQYIPAPTPPPTTPGT